jgi:hypothetical protein
METSNATLAGKEMIPIIPEIELGSLWLGKQDLRHAGAVFVGCHFSSNSTCRPRILAPAFFGSGYSAKAFTSQLGLLVSMSAPHFYTGTCWKVFWPY